MNTCGYPAGAEMTLPVTKLSGAAEPKIREGRIQERLCRKIVRFWKEKIRKSFIGNEKTGLPALVQYRYQGREIFIPAGNESSQRSWLCAAACGGVIDFRGK